MPPFTLSIHKEFKDGVSGGGFTGRQVQVCFLSHECFQFSPVVQLVQSTDTPHEGEDVEMLEVPLGQ